MEWYEDESFWEAFYPVMFPPERFDAAEEQADRILALTGFAGRDILDLCCGPGRHSVALARRGFAVTGVDRTEFLLEKARARAEEAAVSIEWVRQDMRDFIRPDAFDLVVNLFTSFGYFADKDEDRKVLRNIHDSLRSGGAFLMDVVGKEWLAKVFLPTVSQEGPDGSLIVQRHEIFDDWTRVRNEWLVIREGVVRSFRFSHTVYSAQELKDRLLQAGFASVRVYGDLDGRDYDTDALRLIVLARR